VANWS